MSCNAYIGVGQGEIHAQHQAVMDGEPGPWVYVDRFVPRPDTVQMDGAALAFKDNSLGTVYASFFPGLQLTSQIKSGTIGIAASIADGGESYQEMSSGERTLAQMVMGLALRDLTCLRYPGAACNLLLFDEVMGTIDLGRMEQTVNFYDSLLTGAVDTILCISHRAELKEYFPLVWAVRKEEFSELVV